MYQYYVCKYRVPAHRTVGQLGRERFEDHVWLGHGDLRTIADSADRGKTSVR